MMAQHLKLLRSVERSNVSDKINVIPEIYPLPPGMSFRILREGGREMSEAQTFKGKYEWANLEFLEFLEGGGWGQPN